MLRAGMFLGRRYEIIKQIGSGGMSDVYKAKCHKLNRYVAVKVLKREFINDTVFVSKFQAEAEAAARLAHPNVVNVYDVGREGDIYYIVMELAEGFTLKEYIQSKGKLEIAESISIAMQIAQGIEAAHQHMIIHRDIKPQNIIISSDGRVKVTDFGIAKAASSKTISSNTMGSVHYLSPEQARGGYCDERSDIYSLGITLYEMLTGRVPFEGDSTVAVALQHIQGEMIPPRVLEPVIPVSIEKIILKCTQKKPEQRYSSATELISDLKKALMTPDEDFVKPVPLKTDGPTIIFSDEEASRIKAEARQAQEARSKNDAMAEQAYQLGIEEDEEDDQVYDEDDELDDEDVDPRFERIVTAIGIVVAIIIVILAIFVVARAMGLFSGVGKSGGSQTDFTESAEEDGNLTVMPNLLGRTKEQAATLMQEAFLGCRYEYEYSNDTSEGYVISQEYDAGTKISKNTQVLITISSGSDSITIPEDIIGKSEQAARRALVNLGLEVMVEVGFSDDYEAGLVYDCSPKAGGVAPLGSTVTIYTSQGPAARRVAVPNLYNRSEQEAISLLQQSELIPGERTEESSGNVIAGNIIAQGILAGTEVDVGTAIPYVVSLGSGDALVTVPDLGGYTEEEAGNLLSVNNLQLGSVSEEFDSSAPAGTVIWQSVAANTQVQEGTRINITLSKGRDMVTVPGILNEPESSAIGMLAQNGLIASHDASRDQYSDTVGVGMVIGMDHAEGSSVARGTTIYYWLSLGPEETKDTSQENEGGQNSGEEENDGEDSGV